MNRLGLAEVKWCVTVEGFGMNASSSSQPVWIILGSAEVEIARSLAIARLNERGRQLSRDRPSSKNLNAQLRGALGEFGARRWLVGHGLPPAVGFESDSANRSDLEIGKLRLEVMTAQIEHRKSTGYCVPPTKFKAAKKRGAWGYLFVGTGPDMPCDKVLIQAAVRLEHVDADPPTMTSVLASEPVLNHVVRHEYLLEPDELLKAIRLSVG